MNHLISDLSTYVKPGQPLLILGDYGSGKLYLTKAICKQISLMPFCFDVEAATQREWKGYQTGVQCLMDFANTVSNDGLLILENIEEPCPSLVAPILELMMSPIFPVVMLARESPACLSIISRCHIVRMSATYVP